MIRGYKCSIVQAEDGDDFQTYYDSEGKRVPSGHDVGVEIEINGEVKFYLLDDIFID